MKYLKVGAIIIAGSLVCLVMAGLYFATVFIIMLIEEWMTWQ